MSVTVELKNACSSIGEGPHWDDETKNLYFVDILAGGVHKWNYDTHTHEKINLDSTVSFVTPTTKGDLVIGYGREIARVDFTTQDLTKLHEVDKGTRNRFNDGKCDPSGRLWAGTMGYEAEPTKVQREMGTLYSVEKSGELKHHVDKVNISNGLAWSRDNKTMFYIDSIPRKVFAFDFDISTGTLSNQRDCVIFPEDSLATDGVPDGMCMDGDGRLWVACHGGGKVAQFDPETGKRLREVEVPDAPRTTSCCFGGPNLDEMFITCACPMPAETITPWENSGSVFRVTGLGVKGLPMNHFEC